MSKGCPGCLYRDTIILMQRMRIQMLEREVNRLKKIISDAKRTCGNIANNADQVMSQHQPRAKWAFAKAAKAAAQTIHNTLV